MKRKNLKKKEEMSMDRKRGLYQSMARLGDYKTRRAREEFFRPAFEGSEIAARRQRVRSATPEGSRVAPPIIYHDESDFE